LDENVKGNAKEDIDKDEVAKLSDNSICEEEDNKENEEVVPVENTHGEGSVEKSLAGEVNVLPVVEVDEVSTEIDNHLDENVKGNAKEDIDKDEVAKLSDNSICEEEDNKETEEVVPVENSHGAGSVEKSLSSEVNVLPVVEVDEVSAELDKNLDGNGEEAMDKGEVTKTDVLFEVEVDELSLESDENVDNSNEKAVESGEVDVKIELISPALVEEVATPMKLISPDPVSSRIDSNSERETTTSSEPECTFSLKKLKEFVPEKSSIKWSERERYLDENEFEQIFSVTKEEFQKLPKWRQVLKKKEVGLF